MLIRRQRKTEIGDKEIKRNKIRLKQEGYKRI
jgi:hypothetical protein